jgi:CRISPR-associated protein Csm1
MEQELKILVMGALLHDIGKFAQRAKRPYSKEMEGEYLTTYRENLATGILFTPIIL